MDIPKNNGEESKVTKQEDNSLPNDTHAFMVLDTRFEIDKRYEIIDPIGSGAYGVVVAAKDGPTPEDGEPNLVAVKKIVKAFEHKVFALRTYRELKIQRLLDHENVLGIKRILKPRDKKNFNEIYVVTELMETDLAQIIKSNQPLTDDHTQFFLYQILRGLKYIHSACIIHRDLKPRNLLVNSNCDLKICDFGLARADITSLQTNSTALTDYIATRWYRAPEVILSWRKYTGAIDVWSVGCILAELIIRKPLLPATSEEEQLNMITKLLGNPSKKLVDQIENERNREFVLTLPKREGKDFAQIFKGADPTAIDLLKKMLVFDPEERISVTDALAHPYLKALHFPDDEPVTNPVCAYDFDFEKFQLNKDDFKELIYEEIMLYHSDQAALQYISNKKQFPEGNLHNRFGNRYRKAYCQPNDPAGSKNDTDSD